MYSPEGQNKTIPLFLQEKHVLHLYLEQLLLAVDHDLQ